MKIHISPGFAIHLTFKEYSLLFILNDGSYWYSNGSGTYLVFDDGEAFLTK